MSDGWANPLPCPTLATSGDAISKRQAVRRIPFAARQGITDQLEKMQASGVIEPSESPWASPVGNLRFCADY